MHVKYIVPFPITGTLSNTSYRLARVYPAEQFVLYNKLAVITCTSTNTMWFFKDMAIQDQFLKNKEYLIVEDSLVVWSVTRNFFGEYSCLKQHPSGLQLIGTSKLRLKCRRL